MTEPGDETPQQPDTSHSKLDEALGSFKDRAARADTPTVSDNGRPRMNWDPVTDVGAGGTGTGTDTDPRPPADSPSFRFDLGSALARLDGVDPRPDPADVAPDPAAEPLPVRRARSDSPAAPTPSDVPERPLRDAVREAPAAAAPAPLDPLPTRTPRRAPEPTADVPEPPLPTRTPRSAPEPVAPPVERAPEPEPARPQARQARSRSVFEDATPAPTLPAAGAPSLPSQQAAPTMPSQPAAPVGAPMVPVEGMPGLPSLPVTAPPKPAAVAPVDSAPSTPDLNALRSAQIRNDKHQRQSKIFGRSVLALLVVGALVAAALLFGRSYLFPTEWSTELTPLVNELQSERGVEFDHTLALIERPADEYATLVADHVLGDDWVARLPEWRALGIAGGDGAVADVERRVAAMYPAFYDPDSDSIVTTDTGATVAVAEGGDGARTPALRLALGRAFVAQTSPDGLDSGSGAGLTGLEPGLARDAADAAAAGLPGTSPDPLADLAGLPLPVAYRLQALDVLGPALLASDPGFRIGDPLPESAAALDDGAALAVGGLRQPGDQQLLEPVALGRDDWALIWGARIAPAAAELHADELVADTFEVVDRGGATCFVATYQMSSDTAAGALLATLGGWVAAAPVEARAATSQLGPTRIQLEACDPGAVAVAPAVTPVERLLERQLDRIAG